ncbi:hypothetical protein VNO77_16803 [Canavalia gladiata]|uniref:Exostosin GT47 domain-containing protein n=1 Tax=Canavalia gladiata TaxID=3824 RepID=A0AAN9LHT7_CANGL
MIVFIMIVTIDGPKVCLLISQRVRFGFYYLFFLCSLPVFYSILSLSLSLSISLSLMVRSSFLYHYSERRVASAFRGFFFIPTTLALLSSLFILFYIYSTSNLFTHHHQSISHFKSPSSPFSTIPTSPTLIFHHNASHSTISHTFQSVHAHQPQSQRPLPLPPQFTSKGEFENNNDVFHDRDMFLEDYKEMNRSLKIYVYPHRKDDPFANALLPVESEPGGNYASESYFKKVLMKSHFITKDPTEADLFFLPFSIARLRHDGRVGVRGIQDFVRDYIQNISHKYPYWNRTGGADHFYVACHSIGRSAMDKAPDVRFNAIQIVCSSSYFLSGYVAHKDACLPQIWPRKGNPSNLVSSQRKNLAFFAGGVNSQVRIKLLETWKNDSEIFVHHGRLKTPYADALLGSKFCLHVKGFEVNTARIGDSLYYGCVPVIIANYYDLPFADVLNWKSFSVVVTTLDIPLLKKILKGIISSNKYLMLQSNVLKVRKHFQWHSPPLDFDAFYMVMYELWLRRSSIKISLGDSLNSTRFIKMKTASSMFPCIVAYAAMLVYPTRHNQNPINTYHSRSCLSVPPTQTQAFHHRCKSVHREEAIRLPVRRNWFRLGGLFMWIFFGFSIFEEYS